MLDWFLYFFPFGPELWVHLLWNIWTENTWSYVRADEETSSLTCIWGYRLWSCCTGSGTCGHRGCGSAAAIGSWQSWTSHPTRWPAAGPTGPGLRWRWTWWRWGCPKAPGQGPAWGQSAATGWRLTRPEQWPRRPRSTLCTWTFQNPRNEEDATFILQYIYKKQNIITSIMFYSVNSCWNIFNTSKISQYQSAQSFFV